MNPKDDLKGLHRVFYENPATFIPRPDPHTGMLESWGLGIDDWFPIRQREMSSQFLYVKSKEYEGEGWPVFPELQFVHKLMERKESSIQAFR